MRRSLLIVCAALVTAFLPLFAQQKVPMIVFDNETMDLGKVWGGDELKRNFKFTNKGDGLLEIFRVQPG